MLTVVKTVLLAAVFAVLLWLLVRLVKGGSVSRVFSTFACADIGVFEDFFVEPVFRKQGAARQLASAAQEYGRANHLASLAVTCALCDEGMYRALGFTEKLGTTLVHLS